MNAILIGVGVLLPVSVLGAWVWTLHRRLEQCERLLGLTPEASHG